MLFSQSKLSFEEVTLKFIQANRKDALKTFLLKKLETLNQKVYTVYTSCTPCPCHALFTPPSLFCLLVHCVCVCVSVSDFTDSPCPPQDDSTQQTMLTTWLIELFLNEIGGYRDEGDGNAMNKLQHQFHKFLERDILRVNLVVTCPLTVE